MRYRYVEERFPTPFEYGAGSYVVGFNTPHEIERPIPADIAKAIIEQMRAQNAMIFELLQSLPKEEVDRIWYGVAGKAA